MTTTDGTTKPMLTYGWWESKRRAEIPTSLGHKGNYVLTVEELQAYAALLREQQAALNKECAAVALNLNALTASKLLSYANAGNMPRCTTLVDVLVYILERGKGVLALTEMLAAGKKKRKEASDAQERG